MVKNAKTMKRNLLFLLPLLLSLGVACTPKTDVTPVQAPYGTFTGQFGALIKKSATSAGYDTIRDSITLKMTSPAAYAVTGDTTTIHAGSKGSFAYNRYYIQFNDSTKVTTGTGTKFHLKGVYQYGYNGAALTIERYSNTDTALIRYVLKKIN
jgi:hypothetical protein